MTAAAVTAATARRAARGVARGGVRRERHDPAYALLLAAMALTAIGRASCRERVLVTV